MTDSDCPWEPPIAGTEAERLVGALDRLRTTFRWKADDLDAAGLQTRVGSSSLTLGGLLKHLAANEDCAFTTKLKGQPIGAPWDATDWNGDDDWEFTSAAADTPEELYALWEGAVERPGRGSTRPWPAADSISSSTPPGPTVAAVAPTRGGATGGYPAAPGAVYVGEIHQQRGATPCILESLVSAKALLGRGPGSIQEGDAPPHVDRCPGPGSCGAPEPERCRDRV